MAMCFIAQTAWIYLKSWMKINLVAGRIFFCFACLQCKHWETFFSYEQSQNRQQKFCYYSNDQGVLWVFLWKTHIYKKSAQHQQCNCGVFVKILVIIMEVRKPVNKQGPTKQSSVTIIAEPLTYDKSFDKTFDSIMSYSMITVDVLYHFKTFSFCIVQSQSIVCVIFLFYVLFWFS